MVENRSRFRQEELEQVLSSEENACGERRRFGQTLAFSESKFLKGDEPSMLKWVDDFLLDLFLITVAISEFFIFKEELANLRRKILSVLELVKEVCVKVIAGTETCLYAFEVSFQVGVLERSKSTERD